jgi:hypothetical protein
MAARLIRMAGWSDLPDMRSVRAIVLGALVLMWPALWNGYPILYSDTNAFMVQGILHFFIWDKPFVYGPWMSLFHWQYSLWPVLLAQALMVSSILWIATQSAHISGFPDFKSDINPSVMHPVSALRFMLICIVLSLVSAAPWVTSLLMPDIFAPITVLCIYILAVRPDLEPAQRLWVLVIGTFAIASHLSHLVIAAGVLLVVALFGFKRFKVALLPLLLALAVLVTTNLLGFQKFAVSPFGSVFLLARLAADGHIKPVLDQSCIKQKIYMCDWKDRLAVDSDELMWDGQGPVWSHPGGPIGLAPEASVLVAEAVKQNPVGVLQSLVKNTWTELWMVGLGDTLHPDHLDLSVGERLRIYFPEAELKRYQQSRQLRDVLATPISIFNVIGWISTMTGLIACLYFFWRAWVGRQRAGMMLITMIFVGLLANAFATGALSKPHYRYQTRMAWLLVFAPLILTSRIRGNKLTGQRQDYSG